MTLKLEGDQAILKMYPRIENEAASLTHLKLKAWIGQKIRKYVLWSRQLKMSEAPKYFERCHNRYSNQAPAVSNQ